MDWFVTRFIKSALGWLGIGVSLGVAMAAHPMWIIYRPAHVHMNLLMAVGFFMAPHVGARSVPVLATGGVLSALGAFAFIFNIWRTIDGPKALRRISESPASRRPPLAPSDS